MADGNIAEMRAALKQASYFLHRHHMGAVYAPDGETLIYCWDVAKIVDDALSAPPRNCDKYGADGAAVACRKALGADWSHVVLIRKVIGWLYSLAEGEGASNG